MAAPVSLEVPSGWSEGQVNAAIESKLVPQELQARYSQPIAREEFAALAVALYEKANGEILARSTFADTLNPNVEKAAAIGVVEGVGGNRFDPKAHLTREQAAVMLSRLAGALGMPLAAQAPSFADNEVISSWAFGYVGQAQAAKIMGGTGGNAFSPKSAYTIEQSIVTILRLYELTGRS